MKTAISYVLGLFLVASAAQAAPSPAQSASRLLPKTSAAVSDQRAVSQARVKLMNDARNLGPDSPQVQEDKEALINALAKLRGDSSESGRPVDVKRNPGKPRASHKRKSAAAKPRHSKRKLAGNKVSHLRARKGRTV